MIVTRSFLPSRNPNASIVAVSSGVVSMPPKALVGGSSYTTSKIATIKLFEFVAAEYPDVQTLTIHPGIVETAMKQKSDMEGLPMDDGNRIALLKLEGEADRINSQTSRSFHRMGRKS